MYLGVDGGGTKTAFVLVDRMGAIRATHQGGSSFYPETGMAALRSLINEGIRAVLQAARIRVEELDYAYFGLPVHGEDGICSQPRHQIVYETRDQVVAAEALVQGLSCVSAAFRIEHGVSPRLG